MSLGALPEWLSAYVGIPFEACSPTGKDGDCWGLYSLVMARQFGLALPPYEGPRWRSGVPASAAKDVGAAALAYAAQFQPVRPGEELLGDGILIRTYGNPLHVGMVVGPGLMLHVEEYHESVIARYNSIQWANRIASFYRFDPIGRT